MRYPKELQANLEKRTELEEKAAEDPAMQKALMEICAEDYLFWFGTFVWTFRPWTRDPTVDPADVPKIWPFIPWDFQEEAITRIYNAVKGGNDLLIEKTRDMGGTWMVLMVFLHQWLFEERETFLVASDKQAKVDKIDNPDCLMWKLDFALDYMPTWMAPELGGSDRTHQPGHLHNPLTDSVIDGASTTDDIAAGGRRRAILLDEAARWDFLEAAMSTTGDVAPSRLLVSSAQGQGNAFYREKEAGRMPVVTLYWTEHPEKSKGLYEINSDGTINHLDDFEGWVRVSYKGEEQWEWRYFPDVYPFPVDDEDIRQWQYHSPWHDNQCKRRSPKEVAQEIEIHYLKSGSPFFDIDVLNKLEKEQARAPLSERELEWDYDPEHERVRFRGAAKRTNGPLRLWIPIGRSGRPPMDTDYVIACDISMGTGASNSVAAVFSARDRAKVAQFATPHLTPEKFAQAVIALCKWFQGEGGDPYLIWEANGPGLNFGSQIRKLDYFYVYHNRDELDDHPEEGGRPGWFSNNTKKRYVLQQYRAGLWQGDVTTHDLEEIKEAKQYVTLDNGGVDLGTREDMTTGARANHGDRVIAAALGYMGLELQPRTHNPHSRRLPPENSMAGRRMRRLRKRDEKAYWAET